MKDYIGIDLGGTYIKYGIVNEVGCIVKKGKTQTPVGCGYDETVAAISAAVKKLRSEAEIGGVGIGVPGVIDSSQGIAVTSGNLGWENKPLASDLSAVLGRPVVLANDANAAAYGEYMCGSGKEFSSVVLITLGTGVGSGIIADGNLFEGYAGAGAELGHEVIRFGGRRCACGRRGCFEAYASATALIRQTKNAMDKDSGSRLWALCDDNLDNVDGKTAFDGALLGDKTAKQVVGNYLRYLAEGLTNIANAFRPEAILIGGGIGAQGESITLPLQKLVNRRMLGHGRYAPVRILPAMLGNDAGLVGAAMLAKEKK